MNKKLLGLGVVVFMASAVSLFAGVSFDPSAHAAATKGNEGIIKVQDVTKSFMNDDFEVKSFFQDVFKQIPSVENKQVERVYRITAKGEEKRLEFVITGGDGFKYPVSYFITTATKDGKPAAFKIPEFSTSDEETGSTAPALNHKDTNVMMTFIRDTFLGVDGLVNPAYTPLQ